MSALLDFFAADLFNMVAEMPTECEFRGKKFLASRSSYRRENSLGDGGFMNTAAIVITAAYDSVTQEISLGDRITINGSQFRIVGAELSQDAVSVDFTLEDVNR